MELQTAGRQPEVPANASMTVVLRTAIEAQSHWLARPPSGVSVTVDIATTTFNLHATERA